MEEDDPEVTEADAILRLAGNPSLKKLSDKICYEAGRISDHEYELRQLKRQINDLRLAVDTLLAKLR
jgi:hypothetical protein